MSFFGYGKNSRFWLQTNLTLKADSFDGINGKQKKNKKKEDANKISIEKTVKKPSKTTTVDSNCILSRNIFLMELFLETAIFSHVSIISLEHVLSQ